MSKINYTASSASTCSSYSSSICVDCLLGIHHEPSLSACIYFQATIARCESGPDRITKQKNNVPKISVFLIKHGRGIKNENRSSHSLRKVLLRLLNAVLDPQQDSSLPLVQLAQLIELEQLVSEEFLVTGLHRLQQIHKELVLACRSEGGVKFAV